MFRKKERALAIEKANRQMALAAAAIANKNQQAAMNGQNVTSKSTGCILNPVAIALRADCTNVGYLNRLLKITSFSKYSILASR
jgi:hypothetical protein